MGNYKKIFSIAFGAGLLLVFMMCLADYITDKVAAVYTVSAKTDKVEATFATSWNGKDDYPFEDEEEEETDQAESAGSEEAAANKTTGLIVLFKRAARKAFNLAKAAKNKFVNVTDGWTDRVTDSSGLYYAAVYVSRYFDRMCGYNLTTSLSPVNDTLDASDIVVELEDGYLGRVLDEELIEAYGLDNVESLVEFGLSMEEDGRNFLFVAIPEKTELSDYTGSVLEVYEDHCREMRQIALDALTEAGLDNLDMVEIMAEDGMDSVTSFYETDHHWRATTGLYTCGVLGEALNDLYGYQIDTSIFDEGNYTITTLEDWWLGSLGRKVTDVYHDLESLEIIMPDFETDLEVYRSNTNATYSGTIDETLFSWSYFSGSYNVLTNNPYAFYGYGDLAYFTAHNNLVDDGSSVLIIKTSYIDCVAPFFTSAVEDLYVLDLRHFYGSVEALIEEVDPDTVVVMYNSMDFSNKNAWDHTDTFDFR